MSKIKKQLKIPKFKNEDEEREFWAVHDATDYFDESQVIVNPKFPNLKLSTKTISLRLPLSMLDNIKTMANKKDVPYQSYIKVILNERIKEEAGIMQKRSK
jgi:predicted DNA binding CopG/RHH family protein